MKVLILICSLVTVFSQTPCENRPKQWESSILRASRGPSVEPSMVAHRATLTYDEINKRIREVDEYSFSTKTELFEIIALFNTGKEYRINLTTRNCTVSTLTRPFRPYSIPDNATFDGFVTLGAAGISMEFVNLQTWSFMDGTDKFYGTVTSPDCYPVELTEYVQPSTRRTTTYFNTKIGIRDPTVFTPPTECMKL